MRPTVEYSDPVPLLRVDRRIVEGDDVSTDGLPSLGPLCRPNDVRAHPEVMQLVPGQDPKLFGGESAGGRGES